MSTSAQSPAVVPWDFFAGHHGAPFAFFIDRGLEQRPSFAGSRPCEQLVVDADGSVRTWRGRTWQSGTGDPLAHIAAFVDRGRATPADIPSWLTAETLPRTVGFLAYELGRWTDGPLKPPVPRDGLSSAGIGTPLAVLSTYDEVDAWDPRGACRARVRFLRDDVERRDDRIGDSTKATDAAPLPAPHAAAWAPTTREAYRAGFARIREAIAAGEIYQANLSRRAVFDLDEPPAAAYARLREVQPVPWGAFLDFGGFTLLSNSPECFLERRGNEIVTRPIKGTRPRRSDAQLDAAERSELAADPKEMAEHLMIVDLERSDLGRVARTGSVEVARFAQVESFSTVHHMVSEVTASLRDGVDLAALLRATFPGGSITGAPKIRAMEILAAIEAVERGPYTGAIGFFHGSDEVQLSIAIRTALAAEGRILYSAGGGIVADSDPDREWDETELKIAALRTALAGAPSACKTSAAGPRKAGNDG
ncbi:MAG: aminodeoxychorismate synthase component I [Candidatus Binatia bacterium]